MKTRGERPYWLAGSETCSACEHRFVLELGFHCSGCDRPICGQCVLLEATTGEVLCLVCRAAEEEAD